MGPALGVADQGEEDPFLRYRARGGITLTLVALTIIGIFVEIWSHGQPGFIDSFFTPWHAGFIGAFLATAGWMLWPLLAASRWGPRPLALPAAYRLDILGILMFAGGLSCDIIWHTIFGLETSVESLMSPPHVLLVTGTLLMTSSPFRAAWEDQRALSDAPSLRAFIPPLLSVTLVTSMVAHVLIYLWGFANAHYMNPATFARLATIPLAPWEAKALRDVLHAMGIGTIYLTTLVLLAPILIMLRRWRLPFGSITIFLTGTVALMAAVTGFFVAGILAVPIVTGLLADWAVHALQPSPQRTRALRAFATGVPVVMWSLYMLAVHLHSGIAWAARVVGRRDLVVRGGRTWAQPGGRPRPLTTIPCAEVIA